MPQKMCVATLLVFSVLSGGGIAQEFVSSNFGKRIEAEVGPQTAPSARSDEPQSEILDPSRDEQVHLAQPAIYRKPDKYVRPVQPVGYSEASDEMVPDQTQVPLSEVGSTIESPDGLPTTDIPGRELGFPALAPPGESRLSRSGTAPSSQGIGSVVTVFSSLAVVLGLFFMTAWLMRRARPGGLAALPEDVFEVLGRAPLSQRQQVHLVRCGRKLLVVCMTPDSVETLTEIDDPDEVTRLTGLCKANQPGSASVAFRQVLHQFAGQPAEPGFIGSTDSRNTHAASPSGLENLHG